MDRYEHPAGFPDEYMRLLGIIASHWEWVETTMERTVAEAMEFEYDRIGLLSANISFHAHCDLLTIHTKPAEKLRPDIWKEFNSTITDVRTAYTTRNRYIHGKWHLKDGKMHRSEVRTKNGKLITAGEPVKIDELLNAAKSIWAAGERLVKFAQSCGLPKS